MGICVVCGIERSPGDVIVTLHRSEQVVVCSLQHLHDFEEDPERYLRPGKDTDEVPASPIVEDVRPAPAQRTPSARRRGPKKR